MDMQNACREIITEVDGSLGCIVIDTQTGLTVAAANRPGAALNTTMMDLLSIIGTNMFCGQMIRRFEEALDRTKSSGASFVREVQMTTAQTNQFMSAIPGWSGGLLVLITDKSVSLGLGWMAVHRVVKHLGAPSAAPSPAADAPAPTPPLGSAVRTEPSPAALASQPQHQPITAPLPSVAETRTPYHQAPAAQAQHQRPEEDASPPSPLAAGPSVSGSASQSASPSLSPSVSPAAAQPQPLSPAAAERPTSTAAQQPEAPSSPEPTATNTKTSKKAASRAVGPRMNMFSSRQHKKRGAKK